MRPYRKAAFVVGRDRTRRRHRGMREHRFRVRRGQPPDIRRSWRRRSRRARADFGFAIDCAQRWETLGPTIWDGKHLVLNPLRTRAQRLEGLDGLILALTTDTDEIAIAPELHESRQTFHRGRVERRKPRAVRRWPQHAPVQHPGQFEVMDECAADDFPGKIETRDALANRGRALRAAESGCSRDRTVPVDVRSYLPVVQGAWTT